MKALLINKVFWFLVLFDLITRTLVRSLLVVGEKINLYVIIIERSEKYPGNMDNHFILILLNILILGYLLLLYKKYNENLGIVLIIASLLVNLVDRIINVNIVNYFRFTFTNFSFNFSFVYMLIGFFMIIKLYSNLFRK